MVPGDLIFYSAIYNNPKRKRQKHNMVHVEIFLGDETAEQSIGARKKKGVASLFKSFKFKSKGYHDIVWHYRSLDTWLDGICKSFCNIHDWHRGLKEEVNASKYSLFSLEKEEAANDSSDEDELVEEEEKMEVEKDMTKYAGVYINSSKNEELVKDYF